MSSNHYVSNKELLVACTAYSKAYKEAKESGSELPTVPADIGSAIVRIANKLSTNYNFVGYSYRDDMIGDGILKCLAKIHNFDHERSDNPFAFITQICWNSFIERIKIERKAASIKAKMIREKMSSEFVEHGASIDDPDATNAFVEFLKDHDVMVDYFEQSKVEKKNNGVHQSLVHRNKTPYEKREVEEIVTEAEFDLSIFEEETV